MSIIALGVHTAIAAFVALPLGAWVIITWVKEKPPTNER